VCFNPNLVIPRKIRPTLVIAPQIGPEILTGSTRLKAGTATKLLLNIFTTLSMVRLGKVVENLMIDVQPTNAKLRERAVRILRELTGVARPVAEQALQRNEWSVQQALVGLMPADVGPDVP
jgi:N-acetylmuramic acid 6-phosphate (MurNAc-6-P) etherase